MMTEDDIIMMIERSVENKLAELRQQTSGKASKEVEADLLQTGDVRKSGEFGAEADKTKVIGEVYRKTPWAGNKTGVVYPTKGRVILQNAAGLPIIDGASWKNKEEMPPANNGDFVERFPSHNQRVETKSGKTVYRSKSVTITVRKTPSLPSVTDGRANPGCGDGEIVIQAGDITSQSEIRMDASGNLSITVGAGKNVSIGTTGANLNILNKALRNQDISFEPIIQGKPANVAVLSPPVTGGSDKVFVSKQ